MYPEKFWLGSDIYEKRDDFLKDQLSRVHSIKIHLSMGEKLNVVYGKSKRY